MAMETPPPSRMDSPLSNMSSSQTPTRTIHIAMLNTDVPVPNVRAKLGEYGDIFQNLLAAAAKRISPSISITHTNYDSKAFEYPSDLSTIDVILVTGSASSAYDPEPWIQRLDEYIMDIYTNHPRIKFFGSCFGHQLLCQSLLRSHGVIVTKDPMGWELGVRDITLTDAFLENFEGLQKEMRLQFVHADHVSIPSPTSLPEPWKVFGSTSHCAVQGVYEPNRVLTLQGHFEFDRFVNSETLKVFGAEWDPEVLKQTLQAIDADDDSLVAAGMVVRFLLEGREAVKEDGLLTPPSESVLQH